MKHDDIWTGIERLAEIRGLSVSSLARRAGLDPTVFNRSKRVGADGKQRWPSTESLAKILNATGTSLIEFVPMMYPEHVALSRRLPCAILRTETGEVTAAFDADGAPTGTGWEMMDFPELSDLSAFGLIITGNAYAPAYEDGDLIAVSPRASVRRRHRVVLKLRSGPVLLRRLVRRTAWRIDLEMPDLSGIETRMAGDFDWMFRVIWCRFQNGTRS